MQEERLRDQALDAFRDPDADVQRAGIQIALSRFLDDAGLEPMISKTFDQLGSSQRAILIEEVNDPKFMRRQLGVSGAAVSQDRAYASESYKEPDFLEKPMVFHAVLASLRTGTPTCAPRRWTCYAK